MTGCADAGGAEGEHAGTTLREFDHLARIADRQGRMRDDQTGTFAMFVTQAKSRSGS